MVARYAYVEQGKFWGYQMTPKDLKLVLGCFLDAVSLLEMEDKEGRKARSTVPTSRDYRTGPCLFACKSDLRFFDALFIFEICLPA